MDIIVTVKNLYIIALHSDGVSSEMATMLILLALVIEIQASAVPIWSSVCQAHLVQILLI